MKAAKSEQKSVSSNPTADKLATWAFNELIKGGRREYPFQHIRINSQGLHCVPESPSNSSTVSEPICIFNEMQNVSAKLSKDADLLKHYFSHSVIAEDLAEAIERLIELLVGLAGKDTTALHRLYGVALIAALELENLANRENAFQLVRAEARKQSMWPVPYSPHPRWKRFTEANMRRIELGTHNFQKLWRVRATDKSPAGKFAKRIGFTLWRIYNTPGLKFYFRQPADQLHSQGWYPWIIRLFQLPELTNISAPAWFDVGWELLKDATGDKVASVPELARLGKSNADYGRRYATTGRGQSGNQNSRVEGQIKKLLQKAFLARFGNPA